MMQHTNTLRKSYVALGVGGKEKYVKTYEFFKERQQQELYLVKIVFFFLSYVKLSLKTWDRNFPFLSDNAYIIVPNFYKSFAFGTVLHKNVIALADVFPIYCQWEDISVYHPYLQYILIRGTHKMPCSSSLPNHHHLQ
jgi:hypothetical protein